MICNLFVFRHAETTDNSNQIFSGWRDPDLTQKGLLQAQEIARQLEHEKIDYAFTSHLLRAKRTLEIVLKPHLKVPVFIDDRLIERCYGTLQGKSKIEMQQRDLSGLPKFTEVTILRLQTVKASRWLKVELCPLLCNLKGGFDRILVM